MPARGPCRATRPRSAATAATRIPAAAAWGNTIAHRGWSGFSLWGGSLSFDTTVNWHFGLTTSGLAGNELDFYSVATHGLGHILGIGTAPQWFGRVQGAYFFGSHSTGLYGASVPLNGDRSHWADTITVNGQAVSLDPVLNYGMRVTWSVLDRQASATSAGRRECHPRRLRLPAAHSSAGDAAACRRTGPVAGARLRIGGRSGPCLRPGSGWKPRPHWAILHSV